MIANLAAMPVVSAWVMPAGILGVISMPLGLDGACWWLMGHGIDWMIAVALWVTSFPGALGRMAAFGAGPLLLCTGGLVVLCLFKTPLRFIGSFLIGAAIVLMIRAPQPDVLVAADGSAIAVRGENGRLAMIKSGSDVFTLREWLAADADARTPKDDTLGDGMTLRCGGLHRPAARRLARRLREDDRSLRGGLPPRRARGQRRRCAAGLWRPCRRSPGLAALGSHRVAAGGRAL